MFSSRIALKQLVGFCRRVGSSLEAGIDVRTIISRETDRASGPLRWHLTNIGRQINSGQSLTEALADTDDFFPMLMREMVSLGEQSGHLDAVLLQLAEHYDNQIVMRRNFLGAISWPTIQLCIAIVVVGGAIWFMGFIGCGKIDIFGFGLVGTRGLTVYVEFLAVVGAIGWFVVYSLSRGMLWIAPIQKLILRIPGLGSPFQTLALSRLAWSMHVTMNAGMEIRQAMKLSLRSTQNARYIGDIPTIDSEISAGNSIYNAFCRAGGYPDDFLDTLASGEESGRVVESMGILARQYQDRSRAALAILTTLAGWVVWAIVAGMIIFLIFRVFSFYVGTITSFTP